MLEEILNTRIMVKQSMKAAKGDRALMRLLHARQLGLKLIANVTFGYTAANFSGRMPSVEVSPTHMSESPLSKGNSVPFPLLPPRGRHLSVCHAYIRVHSVAREDVNV